MNFFAAVGDNPPWGGVPFEGQDLTTTEGSGRHGKRQIRLGIALVAVSVVLLVALGVGAWLYFSFSAGVSDANNRVGTDILEALDAPPPTTLVTTPPTAIPPEDVAELDAVMNVLVLGTDARPGVPESEGASDVLMLLHIDTRQDFMSIMSIHRDLWVTIPGVGQDRINAAYYLGGPAKTIATVKGTFGVDLNKYVGVGFARFPGIIDRLGGVYVDVDRQYTDTPWWKFDLAPGYQLLSGDNALLYSRYRFDETGNYGRMLRQQRVLAGLREQARGLGNVIKLPGIVDMVMETATTNISANEMLKLAYWLTKLGGERIKQIFVYGPVTNIDGKSVVVPDEAMLAQAVTEFLTPPDGGGAEPPAAAGTGRPTLLVAADDEALRLALAATATTTTTGASGPGDAGGAAPGDAAPILDLAKWQAAQRTVPFTLLAPTYLPEGFTYAGKVPAGDGTYDIRVEGKLKPAVRMIYRYKGSLYLGISATTWTEAPLADDGKVIEDGATTYTLVGTLGTPDHVWWIRDGVLYWVSNTLTYDVGRICWRSPGR